MVSKRTHLDPVDLVQIGSKENTKKQKKSTTEAPPSGHRCLLHPLPPNEEKQVHSKNLSLWNTFGTTSLILLARASPLSLFLFSFPSPLPLGLFSFSFLPFSSPLAFFLSTSFSSSFSSFAPHHSLFLPSFLLPLASLRHSSLLPFLPLPLIPLFVALLLFLLPPPSSFNIFLHLFRTLVFRTLLCFRTFAPAFVILWPLCDLEPFTNLIAKRKEKKEKRKEKEKKRKEKKRREKKEKPIGTRYHLCRFQFVRSLLFFVISYPRYSLVT